MRISRDEYLMGCAVLAAKRTTCLRAPNGVGAIIARDHRIISTGYADPPAGEAHCSSTICDLSRKCDRTIHAEDNAIRFARKYQMDIIGCTMYCTTSPCAACAEKILKAGIYRVVWKDAYRDSSGLELLKRFGTIVEQFNG